MPFKYLDSCLKHFIHVAPVQEASYLEMRKGVPNLQPILYDMEAINGKSSALLGHISLMIAILGVFLVPETVAWVRWWLLVELAMYVLGALLLLRSIDSMGPPFRMPSRETLAEEYYSEIQYRRSLYAYALRGVWILTICLIPVLIYKGSQGPAESNMNSILDALERPAVIEGIGE